MNKLYIGVGLLLLIIVIGFVTKPSNANQIPATVYKSPTCGCCVGFSGELENNNYDVDLISSQDMKSIKDEHGIPSNMESCHTTIVGDYFVEGHVPLEAIDKLLAENPDIDGISLPNMPAGSPGMPGVKQGPFIIYSIKDGEVIGEFTRI